MDSRILVLIILGLVVTNAVSYIVSQIREIIIWKKFLRGKSPISMINQSIARRALKRCYVTVMLWGFMLIPLGLAVVISIKGIIG